MLKSETPVTITRLNNGKSGIAVRSSTNGQHGLLCECVNQRRRTAISYSPSRNSAASRLRQVRRTYDKSGAIFFQTVNQRW